MKKNVVLITALAVFAVALTVVYFLVLNKGDKEPEEEKPGYYTIRTIEAESIDRITLKTEGFDGGFLLRDGTWVNREDATVPVKQETLNLMVSIVLAHLNAFEKVENPPASEDFGFQNPAAVLTAYAGDNSLVTLRVGKSTPTRDRYYAMVDGDDSIYIVSDNYYKYIVKNRTDFFENIKLPEIADRDLLREISVSGEGIEPFHVVYNADNPFDYSETGMYGWYFEAPFTSCVNANIYDDAWFEKLELFTFVSYDKLVAYRPGNYGKYGLDNPVATIYVRYADKYGREDYSYKLFLGNRTEDGSYYARLESLEWVFLIGADKVASRTETDAFALCYKTVFFPKDSALDGIKITAGGKTWDFVNTHADGDISKYTLNGRALSDDELSKLGNEILKLKYSGMAPEEATGDVVMTINTSVADKQKRKDLEIVFYRYTDSVHLVSVNGITEFTMDVRLVDAFLAYLETMK